MAQAIIAAVKVGVQAAIRASVKVAQKVGLEAVIVGVTAGVGVAASKQKIASTPRDFGGASGPDYTRPPDRVKKPDEDIPDWGPLFTLCLLCVCCMYSCSSIISLLVAVDM